MVVLVPTTISLSFDYLRISWSVIWFIISCLSSYWFLHYMISDLESYCLVSINLGSYSSHPTAYAFFVLFFSPSNEDWRHNPWSTVKNPVFRDAINIILWKVIEKLFICVWSNFYQRDWSIYWELGLPTQMTNCNCVWSKKLALYVLLFALYVLLFATPFLNYHIPYHHSGHSCNNDYLSTNREVVLLFFLFSLFFQMRK